MSDSSPITVLATARWQIHWSGCNNPGGGIDGQVTKCRLADGLVFFVRENLARNHFLTSSNARIAMKRGEKSGGVEVLELCCSGGKGRWDELAELVRDVDPKHRPVRRHARFTAKWAEEALSKKRAA